MQNFFSANNSKFFPDPNSGCWVWTGAKTGGYGILMTPRSGMGTRARRKQLRVHRLAYESVHGPIPDGLCVRHSCDNPSCVNPDHLLLGTHADNMDDRTKRNRANRPTGEANPKAKLTNEQVHFIRQTYHKGLGRTYAERFGVTRETIVSIAHNRSWRSQLLEQVRR